MKIFTHLKGLLFLLLIVVSGSAVKAQTISQTFNSSSTFTVPAGITQVTIEAWGGGGKGGSRSGTNNGFGGGGGGAYARKLVTVVPGTTYTVTVGTGATTTAAGNDSWFINATTVLAKGGNSVPLDTSTGATGGAAASCIGDVGGVFSGGNGANGVTSTYGGGGGAGAGTINTGATATNATGATGTNGGGNGGNGSVTNGVNGTAGSTPGGGGGGALRMTGGGTPTGGNGANGQMIITYDVPEIVVLGNSISITDGDTMPSISDWTDFGSSGIGVGITRTFTIQNTSTTAPLSIGAITFSGIGAADYAVTTSPSALVPIGGSTTFVVTFTPSAGGVRSATLSMVNNDPDENPFDFAITGTGLVIGSEMDVQGNATSIVDGDITPSITDWTDFTSTPVGNFITRPFTIYNTGTTNLTIGAITFSGLNAADFTVTTAPAATVLPGGSTNFIIRFNPSAAGLRTATISIVNNDSNENPYNYDLQGTGTEKEIDVFGNAISIVDGDPTPSLTDWTDFGSTDVTSGSLTRTFTIRNTGTTNLTTGAFTFSGPAGADFTLTTSPNPIILPGNASNFTVTFNPSAVGLRSAMLSFVNNDSDENPYNFAIQGTGTEQEIDVQGNLVSIVNNDNTPSLTDWTDFGTSTVGIGVTRTFTILNTGSNTLTIGAITFSGGGIFVLTTPPAASVAPGGSTTFVVTFTPTGLGIVTSGITIANNDSDENPYRFLLQGNGATSPSEMDVQGSAVSIVDGDTTPSLLDWTDFAGSGVGTPTSRTFTIRNSGTGVLVIGAITFGGPNAGDFTVITPPSATVAVSGFTTFEVQFTPGAIGLRSATMSIVNNDADENPYNFSIQGTGFAALTYGPGGVRGNLQLWFRSDLLNGTTGVADGSAVNTWNTQARGTDAIRPGSVGAPVYRNNATHNINFNSVVDFTNNPATSPQNYTDLDPARQYLEGPNGFYSQDIFAVVIPDINVTSATASLDIFCGDRNTSLNQTDGTGLGYGRYTNRFTNEVFTYCLGTTTGAPPSGYGVAHIDNSGTVTYNTAGILNASNNATLNGMNLTFNANNVVNGTNDIPDFGNVNNSPFWMGRSEGWDGSWDGRIGEIITLSNRATTIERSNIQSYLAIKYGITLGVNGTSMNYTNSDGNTIWDVTANSGFNFDIAGIGRDDISRLTQKQSRSINPTEVMTIGLTDILATNTANTSTFATNKSYLLWGANGGTMANSGLPINVDLGPTTVTTITEVVNRKWKVVETGGDVGTTRINIPTAAFVSGLPALGPTDAYVMVVATNSIFTTGVETVFMSTSGSNETCLYDFDNTKFITFGVAHQAVNPLHITLDGIDDFVRIADANELGSTFSIMTWIRPNGANTLGNERTILAKKATATTGYQLVLQNDNRVRIEWRGAFGIPQSTITNTVLPDAKWHNIAVTYGAGTLKMYIDGVQDKSVTLLVPPASSTSNFSIGGQYIDKLNINNLFKGDIDELRMWSRVVTQDEIRFIMNQEILQTGTGTRGTIIPTTVTKNDINSLLWANLFAYYSMNSYIGTHLDDDSFNTNRGSLVIPDKISINLQTAPMPYQSAVNGQWALTSTWANGAIQDLPYSLSIIDNVTPIDWNIVRTSHNVISKGNKTLLGLFVDANSLIASNDSKVEVSHYLKINGQLFLEGKSQLIQTLNSDLDPTSSGSLRRDQQGQKSYFNYNYWSSPVGAINATTNNNAYTVNTVMKDGTTATPQNINWTTGLYGNNTSPITLSSYWIFKFQNLSNAYANWQSVGPNGSLNPGQGYTLKGSNAATPNQNYTFVGKPNNGLITATVAPTNLNLSGNPYASALDANAFITANSTTTTGALYFWEHYSTNTSHNLLAYQGGYATRTLVGGTPPVAPPGISGLGSSTKIPNQYIPVGQGFFVVGSATGGTITFNNNQRAFFKEDNAASFTMFRNNNNLLTVGHFDDNSEDVLPAVTNFKKVRLGFDDRNGYHRQILLGFMEQLATSGIDAGYDATHLDSQTNDLTFLNGTIKLNICGDGYFNVDNIYPLSVKTDAIGTVNFTIDETENFDDNFEAFIYDADTDIYHNIRHTNFTIELPQGTNNTRFSLRFKNQNGPLGTNDYSLNDGIVVAYTNANDMLNIKNNVTDTTVEKVTLYNMLGQLITSWDTKEENQQNIQLPIKNLSTGTYIVKIKTDKGDTSKKIIIN
jgi:trimeric autotransporter adhesin